jgi:pimeloyl-ACP methyl ester carboxylesterase
MVGDDDQVTLEHTVSVFRAIPNAELAILPEASHAGPLKKPELVNQIVLDFLDNDPVPTMAPIWRAPDVA